MGAEQHPPSVLGSAPGRRHVGVLLTSVEMTNTPAPTATKTVVPSPMQYLDRATGVLRDLGLMPAKIDEQPIIPLLQKISDLDQERITVIAPFCEKAGWSLVLASVTVKASALLSRPPPLPFLPLP